MAKASPMVRAFNAGEFSELMDGRTDVERYPASMRRLLNFIAAPQGPAVSRSGTAFVTPAKANNVKSVVVPFVFSNEQAKLLEFSDNRIRFVDEDGLQVYAPVSATVTSAAGATMVFSAPGLNAEVGDQVSLSSFPAQYNLNGETANVTAKSGDVYTIDLQYPALPVVNGTVARVYHVPCVYTEAERTGIRYVQSVDVLYLLTGSRPRKLSRYGDYDWRIENVSFIDGPYMNVNETTTELTPTGTGNAVPVMTSDTAPSGEATGSTKRPAISGTVEDPFDFLGRDISYAMDASEFYYAFTDDDEQYWAGDEQQKGYIEYTPAAPFVCDGYTIYASLDNQDTSYSAKDYAPGTFELQGFNGTSWVTIDRQENYVLYDNNKSVFIEVQNETSYQSYRLQIFKLTRNGLIEARVRRLVLRSADNINFSMSASSVIGINNDAGFGAGDVGRLIRVKGSDNAWRSVEIVSITNPTTVAVKLLGEPLPNLKAIKQWRLGYWSDGTGWPVAGDFFEDKLWLAGPFAAPDMFAGSVTGDYENFSQTDTFGEVLDDSAVVQRLNSRKLSRIRWLSSDDRGLVMGTGSEEYTVRAPNNEAITARNIKARPSTRRGSADVEPVRIDSQVLYVQRSKRTIREFAYVYEADGYRSPSMSQLASHIGAVQFEEMDYAAEPHSVVWFRRADGSLVGLTYNRDENVIGWHQHDLSGGVIESLAVLPQKDQLQDALWVVVNRTVNNQVVRYIERLTPFWDFGTTLDEAHFVDCGLRYIGDPISVVYGLQHLEGREVYGLADRRPVGPFTVVNGSVELPYEASNIIIGLGYDSEAETSRLENGAADGTAMGKVKRINSIVTNVWNSFGGEIGTYNSEMKGPVYNPLEYPGNFSQIEDVELYTGMIGPIMPEPSYDMQGVLYFRRPKGSPLPFNILAIMPQLNTQDK